MIDLRTSEIADICVLTAVDVEFKVAAGLLSEKSFSDDAQMKILRGLYGGRRIAILQSGMGARGFADAFAEHLTSNRYDALIVAGLAGALDPQLRVGDAVLYNLCYDASSSEGARGEKTKESPIALVSDEFLSGRVSAALTRAGLFFINAPGITVNGIATDSKEKLALGVRYAAAAVDMETSHALRACERFDLPAAALRVISDKAGSDLPDFNKAYDARGRINGWRMAAAMIARPSASLRLALSIRPALHSLKISLQAALKA